MNFIPQTQNSHSSSNEGIESLASVVATMSMNSSSDQRGAIFTRREVVDFILDLVGYSESHPLHTKRILEPSCGGGDFLIPMIERLLKSWRKYSGNINSPEIDLKNAILAVELHSATKEETSAKIFDLLTEEGISPIAASSLVASWIIQGDFLLIPDLRPNFDFVVGNPPYVRQEMIPEALINEYRLRYQTIYDRADLYIPFIERSLSLLKKDAELGFICSDRWMKNKYGGPLRSFISKEFSLKFYVDMVDTPAFQSDVIAYPAITIISNRKNKKTLAAYRPAIDPANLKNLSSILLSETIDNSATALVKEIFNVFNGTEPWILDVADKLNIVRRLESDLPLIEEVGCKVGIGVATGADKVFISAFYTLDVEDDRKLPIVNTDDIVNESISWNGNGVINPFNDDGTLVDLLEYPRLNKYLNQHSEAIKKRHVATKNPNRWYRTIDRIYPKIVFQPKLLIPDIKGEAHIVYDSGEYYPHHNLYYITSSTWDLHALQSVLRSGIAKLFVSIYSPQMRGGYLRFQAQYLRRIRLPKWEDVPDDIKRNLAIAGRNNDISAANRATYTLYGLNNEEIRIISETN